MSATHYCIWYRISGDPAKARTAVNALMLTGTDMMLCARFCAVTTTSSRRVDSLSLSVLSPDVATGTSLAVPP